MVAISRDSRASVTSKYSRGKENLETLEEHGCSILHGVDAHSIDRHPDLKGRLFNMIIFNFPHAGCHSEYIVESSEDQIKRHRKLVKGFLMNASTLLSCDGEIHMTHKKCYPFSEWKDNELGEEVGLKVLEEVEFSKWDYPGYHNKKCYGRHPDKTFPVGYSTTLKFVLK